MKNKALVLTKNTKEKTAYYVDSCIKVGLNPTTTYSYIDHSLFDCLILTGGMDVDPSLYGKERNSTITLTDIEYDKVCLKLIDEFYKNKKPILGICRGLQLINVYFNGTLNLDIKNHKLKDDCLHEIKNLENSFLYKIYGPIAFVNSSHHQSIDKLGCGLTITSTSKDNVIEGIEKDNIIAVQWHPERMTDGIKIFEYFKNMI